MYGVEESLESGLVFVGDIERADDALGFSDDEFSFDESEIPRIFAFVPVIAQDKVLAVGHCYRPEIPHGSDRGDAHNGMGRTVELFHGEYRFFPEIIRQIFCLARIDFCILE